MLWYKDDSFRRSRRHAIVRGAFVLRAKNLGYRVVSGASFTMLGITLRTLLTIGSMAILARLLTPSDFGYIAMATTVTELAALFGSFGFSNILVQRKVITRLQMDTVFWTGLIVGVLLTGVVFSLSFLAERLFGDRVIGDILRILCLTFLIGSFTLVSDAIIARMMWFRLEFWIQMAAVLSRSLVAIVFAYAGFGVWSLVAGGLAGSIGSALLAFVAVPYLPRLRFHWAYLTSTWRTSGSYLGNSMLYYISMNIDVMLIGRQLGAQALGYYQNSRSLTDEVRARLAMPLQRVLFPAFSALQADRGRMQQSVVHSGRLLAAVIVPVGFGISAVADELVPVLYGPQWLDMIPVLSMFGLSAAVRGSTAIASSLFNSRDRVGLGFRYNVVGTIILIVAVLVTLPHGIATVSAGVAAASLYSLISFGASLRLIGLGGKNVWLILGPPAASAILMWLSIYFGRPYVMTWLDTQSMRLFVLIGFGAVVYGLVLHATSRQYLKDFIDLARRLVKSSRSDSSGRENDHSDNQRQGN